MENYNNNFSIPKPAVQAARVKIGDALDVLKRADTDEELAQRIFVDWDMKQKQSYAASILDGTNLTSLFVIADVHSIIRTLDEDIEVMKKRSSEGDDVTEALKSLKENRKYFQGLLNKDKDYLLLDGKHRSELLNEIFVTKEFVFDDSHFDDQTTFTDTIRLNDIPISINRKTLKDFDPRLTEVLMEETHVLMTIVRNGNIEDMQRIFRNTNSGVVLFAMELRICTQSDMARFVRSLSSPIENPTIYSLFNRMKAINTNKKKSEKDIKKKGDLLLITDIIAYYLNRVAKSNRINFTNDAYRDKMYRYDFPITSNSSKKFINNILNIFAVGAHEQYKANTNKFNITVGWADTINIIQTMMHLCYGNFNYLKSIGKKVKVNNKSLFFRKLFDCMVHLRNKDLYELDANGNKQPVLKKDGTPKTDGNGKIVYQMNDHSFARKNTNAANYANMIDRMTMIEEYIQENSVIQDMVDEGIITLVDSNRSVSLSHKRYQAIVNQNSKDIFTQKPLTLGEIDSGKHTANCHVVAHSEGGSRTVVGNAKANLKSKTDTIYSEV